MSARLVRMGAALLALLALTGCGDPQLWTRYRADRALWHARRLATRVAAQGKSASPAAVARADEALARVADTFGGEGARRDAALLSAGAPGRAAVIAGGLATLERGRLAAAVGRDAFAAERWLEAARLYAPISDEVAIPALQLGADALERLDRFAAADSVRRVLSLASIASRNSDRLNREVIAATLWLVRERRAEGREAEVPELLRAPMADAAQALAQAHPPRSVAIAEGLAQLQIALGDGPGALASLRRALLDSPAWEAPARAATLAAAALDAGSPESAFAYVRWASGANASRRTAGQALMAGAQAWERLGQRDSALALYDQVLRRWVDPGIWGAPAHFRRAELMEHTGEWESARSEYRALAASNPTHPLAFLALQRIVRHHLEASEPELARIAGEDAVVNLTHLLEINADPVVQRQARVVRGDLLLMLGRTAEAESCFVDLWQRFPADSAAEDAALRAAALAEHQPGGEARAGVVLAGLASHAVNVTVRQAAAARLAERKPSP